MNRENYRRAMDSLSFSADFAERTTAMLQDCAGQTKKEEPVMHVKRSKKIAILLAAAVALLVISVSAANPEALQEIVWELKATFFVSGETEDGSFAAIRVPEVTLADRDDRVILTIEGEEADITDTLTAAQLYTVEQEEENGRLLIEVTGTPEDCLCTIRGYRADEEKPLFTVIRGKNGSLSGDVSYQTPEGETVTSDESVVINGNAYSNQETVTITKNDEFTLGAYNGGDIYGLDTDDLTD